MPRPTISARSLPGMLALVLLAGGAATAAEYPGVDQLPSRPALPDPLVMFDGRRVGSPSEWTSTRRPELKALFQYYMYGAMPPAPAQIRTKVAREDDQYFGGKATKKEVTIAFGPPGTPEITL